MGRPKGVPKYLRHKASGQAVVRIDGRDVYLGVYGSPESRKRYAEEIARLGSGYSQPPPGGVIVAELLSRYDDFAKGYYQPKQYHRVRQALSVVTKLFATKKAAAFGPAALEACRAVMVDRGWSRNYTNACVGIVRRCWKWGVSKELVPVAAYDALCCLSDLAQGKSEAVEHAPQGPVKEEDVEATVALMLPTTADMVRVQRLTGMRAGELVAMRAEQVERKGRVWTYRPASHKTQHLGFAREIMLGPKAQKILKRYLQERTEGYVFSPARAVEAWHVTLRAARKTPVQPSQADRSKPAPKVAPGECYTVNSYNQAIRRACDAAGVPRWRAHQLRHAKATELREAFGLEHAQGVLGHASIAATEIYAQQSRARAEEAARRLG